MKISTFDFTFLSRWFLSQQRDLPWREKDSVPSPYKVWVSEVMLQQTQVKTVIPYFERWMALFPTLTALAEADEKEVIKAWEGLGYYSRARNLHAGAKTCVEKFGGNIPQDKDQLSSLKGIGPYTLGAIRSFAFREKAVALDGNVARVMSRLLCESGDIMQNSTKKIFEKAVLDSLPDKESWVAMEALIELGATICTPKPKCFLCPMNSQCQAFKLGEAENLPNKKKGPATTHLSRAVLILATSTHVLLKEGIKGKIMEGLWEFPYFEDSLPPTLGPYILSPTITFESVSHTFTRFKATLTPFQLTVDSAHPIEGYQWIEKTHIKNIPFSSGHRKLLNHL